MATAAVLSPHDVPTTLNYTQLDSDNEAPYIYLGAPPVGRPRTNIKEDPHPVVIHDVRGREDTVSLDKTGFQFVKHVSEEEDFLDEERITTRYYKEVAELLKKEAGAKKVFLFDHTIRRDYERNANAVGSNPNPRGPAKRVHVDQTYEASVARVHRHLGDEAERLLKSRVRIINVWRPIGHPVAHIPLAVADYYSLDHKNDLIPVRLIYPDREGAVLNFKHNPQHRWYFLADQTPEEVTLIKCFDSEVDKARMSPHSAFVDNSSPESAPERQSIEVRALIFDTE